MCASTSLVKSMNGQKFVMQNLAKYMHRLSYLLIFYHVMLNVCFANGVVAQYPDDSKLPGTSNDENIIHQIPVDGTDSTKKVSSADVGFIHAFVAALSVIIVSELGDKTFFIAAIMAMRHPRLTVFSGAILALAVMTILSVVFGLAAHFIPRVYTYYISTALFAIFGLKMLKEGYSMRDQNQEEEIEDVQSDLKKREDELEKESSLIDAESGVIRKTSIRKGGLMFRIFMQAFTMTFLAEWGDRSQLTTIILGARENAYGVIIGGVLGHAICTGLAVIGGKMIAKRISVRTVTLIGGVVFLLFALSSLFFNPNEEESSP